MIIEMMMIKTITGWSTMGARDKDNKYIHCGDEADVCGVEGGNFCSDCSSRGDPFWGLQVMNILMLQYQIALIILVIFH